MDKLKTTLCALVLAAVPSIANAFYFGDNATSNKSDLLDDSKPYVHVVQPGENLSGIAKKECGFESDYGSLAYYAGIKNPNLIYPGQRIPIRCTMRGISIIGGVIF